MLQLDKLAHPSKIIAPRRVGWMVSQHPLDVGPLPGAHRIEMGDHLPSTDDGEVFAVMLDGVEQIGEVPWLHPWR